MHKLLLVLLQVGFAAALVMGQDRWTDAESKLTRLSPRTFSLLPFPIIEYLEHRKCLIPQTYFHDEPHNVVKGEFAKKGQVDWAVLCSVNRESSILIFWRGSTRSVSEIAKTPDGDFLQTVSGDGKIGFSRSISAAGKEYIERQYESYGGQKPPPSTHQGINDAFLEKASEIHYLYRRRWMVLQGAD